MGTYAVPLSAPATDKDVPLSLFGGANTELSPSDLPEGGSPGSQDVTFVPGGVYTRPGLHQILTASVSSPIVYSKTYVQPNGVPITLMLTSSGGLLTEYPTISPGVVNFIRQGSPDTFALSVTAFGREYIAISDGQVGADIPLQFDGTNLDRVTQDSPGAPPTVSSTTPVSQALAAQGAPGTITISTAKGSDRITLPPIPGDGPEFVWTTITYVTTTPHGLSVGDSINISGDSDSGANVGPCSVLSVVNATTFKVSVVLDYMVNGTGGTTTSASYILTRTSNTVTAVTATPSGLVVGNFVQVSGVANTSIGGGISSISRIAGITTVTMSSSPFLSPGNTVIVSGVSDVTYNGTFQVLAVTSPTTFTYENPAADGSSSGGNVYDIWNGTFPVTAIISSTSFQYLDDGPNDLATGTGTVVQFGQLSPGVHQVVQLFRTRQGALTAPSPPVSFTANGGTSILISNLAIGPPNVTERILAFTGSGGDNFFYIGIPAVANGVQVSTSTVVQDNTSTSVLVDFSDNTLFAATAIDIPGNNLFAQVVLGPCLGFGAYASRLLAWGERVKIQNFLNMGFAGGYIGSTSNPTGWSVSGAGALVDTDVGFGWLMPGGCWNNIPA